jgi:CheY-like chemotaxis protein
MKAGCMEILLVVEDNTNHRNLMVKTLQKEFPEAHIVDVDTGEKALAFLDNVIPHLVVLDLLLPGVSGYEVMRRIRTMKREVPVIIMSGVDLDHVRKNMEDLGGYYYIGKGDSIVTKLPLLARSAYEIVHRGAIEGPLAKIEKSCADLQRVLDENRRGQEAAVGIAGG